jgi:signal transduction histidine kinase
MDLARIDTGRLPLERQEFRIPTLIHEVLEDLTPMAETKKQRLEKDIAPDCTTGWFDRDRIEQVLLTLVTNSIRYTPPGETIRLSVRLLEKEILFSVSDTGPGIPANEQNAIFDRYRELKSQRVCQEVGLPLARGIVEAHEGKLWLDTESGPGSILRFTLPLAKSVGASDSN